MRPLLFLLPLVAKHPAFWTESIAATPGNADVEPLVTERVEEWAFDEA